MSASAFSLSVAVPANGFAVTRGDPVICASMATSPATHFIASGKSWVFLVEPELGFVNVRRHFVDNHTTFAPFVEFWTEGETPLGSDTRKAQFSRPSPQSMETFLGSLRAEFAASSKHL